MDTLWSVDGENVRVELTPAPHKSWTATVNGHSVEVVSYSKGRLLLGDGRVFDYAADWAQPRKRATLHHAAQSLVVERVGDLRGGAAGGVASGTATAPMNGQVSKILKTINDELANGEVVLVLEAMKMENEVCASVAGRLKAILVSVGENVTPGQKLFEVEVKAT